MRRFQIRKNKERFPASLIQAVKKLPAGEKLVIRVPAGDDALHHCEALRHILSRLGYKFNASWKKHKGKKIEIKNVHIPIKNVPPGRYTWLLGDLVSSDGKTRSKFVSADENPKLYAKIMAAKPIVTNAELLKVLDNLSFQMAGIRDQLRKMTK